MDSFRFKSSEKKEDPLIDKLVGVNADFLKDSCLTVAMTNAFQISPNRFVPLKIKDHVSTCSKLFLYVIDISNLLK